MNLENVQTVLLDADGVLWRGSEPIPSLNQFFNTLRQIGVSWGVVTNNGTKTVQDLVQKLDAFGVKADPATIVTSATATADYLTRELGPSSKVYVVGESGVKSAINDAHFTVFDDGNAPATVDAVVVGIDRDITYAKLDNAARLIREGARFIATNTDATFPTPEGLSPGAGTIVAAVTTASGTEPTIIGKPSSPIFETSLHRLSAQIPSTIAVGDRLETDILGANRLGIRSILVLTGVSQSDDVQASGIQPDLILPDIGDLADQLLRARQG
jgi:4-nitrophenyl phosphatase